MKSDATILLEALIAFKKKGCELLVEEDGHKFSASVKEDGQTLALALGVDSQTGYFTVKDEALAAGFPEDGCLAPLKPYVDKAVSEAMRRHGVEQEDLLDQQQIDNIYANALYVTACYGRDLRKSYRGKKVSYYVSVENPFGIRVHLPRCAGNDPDAICQAIPDLDELVDELVDEICTT